VAAMTVEVDTAEVDRLLDQLTEAWESLPEVAAAFETCSPYEQSDVVEEWPLETMRLARLERHVARGALTPAQAARYVALRELIQRHEPLLIRILSR